MLGQAVDAARVLDELQVNGAIVVPGALLPGERDAVLASLMDAKVHVHLATGLRGIDSRRLRSLPLGHEPLLYLEPPGMHAPWYSHLKRLIDIVLATVALLVVAPLYVLAAAAIKLTDGGPVLFRQERVGMGNRPFGIYKLRSMSVDAEERLADLIDQNQRDGGPLFKLDNDPRVTRVGAFLRATSFDEIPQLFNVLRGEMSLVGPRPALPGEVAEFDDELLVRQQVRPGVTGLWQVEARDKPSFSAYRYLDVFYVENQSLALDVTILLATVRAVAVSCARALRIRRAAPDVEVAIT
jgi:lipopolysaccharide/colanic/teichoic acid biosynthesis glycosyltransferase